MRKNAAGEARNRWSEQRRMRSAPSVPIVAMTLPGAVMVLALGGVRALAQAPNPEEEGQPPAVQQRPVEKQKPTEKERTTEKQKPMSQQMKKPAGGITEARSPEAVIMDWPSAAKQAAQKMITKYGTPDEITAQRLIWRDTGPWSEIIAYREEIPHNFPRKHMDVLEQKIHFKIPADKIDDLIRYDGSVISERTKGTLAARCDREEMNFLALNLAHDILTGKRDVEDARQFYGDTVQRFMKGEKPPYTQRLQFEVPKGDMGDPDAALPPAA